MKQNYVLFLIIALIANSIVGTGICSMEHDIISSQSQSHSMPCQDTEQNHVVTSHFCDCDMCVQYVSNDKGDKASGQIIELVVFSGTFYQSVNTSPRYRPPIKFSI